MRTYLRPFEQFKQRILKGFFIQLLLLAVLPFSFVWGQKNIPLFTLMKPEATQVKFVNKVREDDSLHVLVYEYLYNGHGIGIGDFNNDGQQDIFISGNTTPNKLFLNRGGLKFEDVAKRAGVSGNGTWSTGVSVADVNGDGKLDIYVCHSGKFSERKLQNELFINTGTVKGYPQFEERSMAYGLHAPGTQSTQAAFFDYDKDGDLDMFLLNHSVNTYYAFLNTRKTRSTPDFRYGNRLFRNDKRPDGSTGFTEVTLQAGIINNPLNYGLSVNISDIDQDGWPDIYTTSDYSEHDCLYINNRDGTFTQSLQRSFHHISKFSMGADIADFNNDALPDVFTLDMLPEDNHRQKLLKGPDEYDAYHLLLDSGYYRQHMRNMLHLNRGKDANGNVRFSEIAQLSGVSNTDWSWAGLFADLDADGLKDIVITNGYLRDFTDLDFLKYTMPDAQLAAAAKGDLNFKNYSLVQKMPSNKLGNYLFRNNGDLTFSNVSHQWGFNSPTISNAAAYADLDNDGDLDLVVGNNNEPVMIWRNNMAGPDHHWLEVRLQSDRSNRYALGAKIWVYEGDRVQYQELYPVRGFQSSVSTDLYFGLNSATVDSLKIEWPSGKVSVIHRLSCDRLITVREDDQHAESIPGRSTERGKLFAYALQPEQIDFIHRENDFVDFKVEVLIPYQLSRTGPALAKADVNGDGNEDIFIGGAVGQSGELLLQNENGSFFRQQNNPWEGDAQSEDVNALFFDADGDGDSDLYIVSGGSEYLDGSPEFQDRLYVNNGKGIFSKAINALPEMRSNKHAIASGDFDNDGDEDLFVGGRGKPGYFPLSSRSYILRNDTKEGKAKFTDVTKSVSSELEFPGMVTVASWSDLDNDQYPELWIGGDWMPVMLFKNRSGRLQNISEASGVGNTHGQWGAMLVTDIDEDGDMDVVMGNCGLNNQFKPSDKEPMTMHVNDFDGNGNIDPIICYYIQGESYPMASRDELLDQIPSLKKRFVRYIDYADATLETIFPKVKLAEASVLECKTAESMVLINDGNQRFSKKVLPMEAQFSKVQSILSGDYNKDGHTDLVLLGNFFAYRTQQGESDASLGLLLEGDGAGNFVPATPEASGLFADGDVRAAVVVKNAGGEKKIVVAKNNDKVQVILIQQ